LNPTTPPGPKAVRNRRGIVFQLAAVALVVVSALAATGLARLLRQSTTQDKDKQPAAKFPGRLFRDWDKPDLVIVLTGQQHGYLEPCGCSSPQVGGLERRYNLLKLFESNGWPYAAVDLGDVPQNTGPAGLPNQQGMIKYVYSMKALKAMNYAIVGFGEYEVKLGLEDVLGQHAQDDDLKVVATNLMDAEKNFPLEIVPWKPVDVTVGKKETVHLGVVAITDPTIATRIKNLNPKIRFANSKPTLDNVVKQLGKSEVDLGVLLYQGPVSRNGMKKPSEGAVACAEDHPQFPIVLCHSEEDDPAMAPVKVTTKSGSESLLISVGHKGKFVGVVGVWRTGKKEAPYRFKYERVEMSEDFKTDKDKRKDHPIVALMDEYKKDLRDKNYLEKYGQVRHLLQVMPEVNGLKKPGEVAYAGTKACLKCHEDAYDVWKKSAHSHAYDTLVKETYPSNSQFDPECIVCHTVGFGNQSGFVTDKKTPNLKDVGCESCHGPSSLHAANPNDKEWRKRVNPWRYLHPDDKKKREYAIDQMCQKCHDQENDVTWLNGGFKRKWPKVDHPLPGNEDEDEKDKP
jgi:hypothetical protein